MAKFTKGMTRPEGAGRKKGSVTYVTVSLRETLAAFFTQQLQPDVLSAKLDLLDPKDQLDIMIRLMPFFMAKMQAVTITDESTVLPSKIEVVILNGTYDTELE